MPPLRSCRLHSCCRQQSASSAEHSRVTTLEEAVFLKSRQHDSSFLQSRSFPVPILVTVFLPRCSEAYSPEGGQEAAPHPTCPL